MNGIAVITNGNYFSSLILEQLLNSEELQVCCAIVITGDYKGRPGLKAAWPLARVTAFPYLVYKILTLVIFRISRLFGAAHTCAIKDLLRLKSIPTMVAAKVNTPEVTAFLKQHAPDLLVSVSCPQRIKAELLAIPVVGSINIHSSLLPQYAGLAPYYWVLSHGEEQTGVTVHYMTEKFDDGDILVQERISIPARTTAFALFRQLSVIGASALVRAAELALKKHPGTKQDLSARSYYSHPTFQSYRKLKQHGHRLWCVSDLAHALFESRPRIDADQKQTRVTDKQGFKN